MTKRAVLLGFIGVVAICTLTYLNDYVLRQTFLVGNHFPVSVYGSLIIFLLLNGSLFALNRRLALTGKEFAIILAMTLAACSIPSSGLLRTFTSTIIMPHHHAKTKPGWQKHNVIDETTPEQMLVDVDEKVHEGSLAQVQNEKTLVLDEKADGEFAGMKVKLLSGKGKGQVRRIQDYDPKTQAVTLADKWKTKPAAGDEYEILKNNEDEVLVPFIQGRIQSQDMQFTVPNTGKCEAVDDQTVTLAEGASKIDGTYAGMQIAFDVGGDEPLARKIVEYDGKTQQAKLNKGIGTLPPKTPYEISQTIKKAPLAFWHVPTYSGVVQSAGPNTIVLPPVASNTPDAFCDMKIEITSGPAKGEALTVIDYNGGAREATVIDKWKTQPQPGDTFSIKLERNTNLAGTIASADAKSAVLMPAAGHLDQEHVSATLAITAGPGAGQERRISEYKGETTTAILDQEWDTVPTAQSRYEIKPQATVPWSAWKRALMFWMPLIGVIWLAMIGLALVVHKQWSDHEHLPYPIAALTDSLLPEEGKGISSILRARGFWIAGGVVFAIYMNNYFFNWFPNVWVQVPLQFDFSELVKSVPLFKKAYYLYKPTIYFTVIAVAYFLATDVSFSVGIAPLFYAILTLGLSTYGFQMNSAGYWTFSESRFMFFGAALGAGILIFYTGRSYYKSVLSKALFLPYGDDVPKPAVWGLRSFIVGLIGFTAILTTTGLSWQLGLLYGLILALMFLMMSRIIAETGLFFIQPYWMPCGIIIGMLGIRGMTPETLGILMLLTMVLAVDPREALMPFMVNALKIAEHRKEKVGRTGLLCAAAVVVGLAVAVPWTITQQYKRGVNMSDGWAIGGVAQISFNETVKLKQRMQAQGLLEDNTSNAGLGLGKIRPMKWTYLATLGTGLGLFLLFSFLRLRFTKWPLHPLIFLIWASYATHRFAVAFLVGWMLKAIILRFGGSKVYHSLKPVVIGLVAGEFLGALLPILIGFLYFLITGEMPKKFAIFPG